jgi:hypothetical protein
MARPPVFADELSGTIYFLCEALIRCDDFIQRIGNLAGNAILIAWQPHGEISVSHGLQNAKQFFEVEIVRWLAIRFARHH